MGEKNSDIVAIPTLVFKLELHCGGCVEKLDKDLRHLPDVYCVKADLTNGTLTVVGKVKERIQVTSNKKVELVSPQPQDKKPKEAPAPAEATVVLKTDVHCIGCAKRMNKMIRKRKGVETVKVDLDNNRIEVKGTMDVKEVLSYLHSKWKRLFEVVPPPAKKNHKEDCPKMEHCGYPNYVCGAPLVEYGTAPPCYSHAPPMSQMFSDENPYSCSIM